jgi:flagellar biosynthesis/type III secretory pathway chaperone
MKERMNRLASAMTVLKELYHSFQALLVTEQELIAVSKLDEMGPLVKEKEEMVQRIQAAEERRLAIVREIAAEAGLNPAGLGMERIMELASAEERAALREAKHSLQAMVARVKALNEINTRLLSDAVAYIHTAFELVTGKRQVDRGYQRSGQAAKSVQVARNLVNTTV